MAAPPGKGLYCFRIQGQTYYMTTTMHPPNDQPKYGQLYIIDADGALQQRMDVPQHSVRFHVTMRKINVVIRKLILMQNCRTIIEWNKLGARRHNVPIRSCELRFRRGSDIYKIETLVYIPGIFLLK